MAREYGRYLTRTHRDCYMALVCYPDCHACQGKAKEETA